MKKILIISLVLLAYFSNLTAQETDKKCKFKLSGFGIEASENFLRDEPYTFDNFKAAYKDQLAIKPIDSLSYSTSYNPFNTKYGIYLSFSPVTQNHIFFSEFRLGLSFNLNSRAGFYAQEYLLFPKDTLVNEPYLVIDRDSSYSIFSAYWLSFQDLSLSAMYLIKSDPNKRFNIFAGLGFEIGRSINSRIIERQRYGFSVQYKYKVIYPGIDQYSYGLSGSFQDYIHNSYEKTKIANSTFLRATLPVGVSMRFSKKDNLCGKMSMSLNARFGLDMMFNPDLGTNAAFFRGWALGFKYSI